MQYKSIPYELVSEAANSKSLVAYLHNLLWLTIFYAALVLQMCTRCGAAS